MLSALLAISPKFAWFWGPGYLPSVAGILVILLSIAIPAIYYMFFMPYPKWSPPRFHYLSRALKGEFNMEKTGPMGMLLAGYKQLGDVFRFKVANLNVTALVGTDAQAVFFEGTDDEVSQREPYYFTVPVFGKGIVYDAPQRVMMQQLKFISKGLMYSSLKSHCSKIVQEAQEFYGKWGESGEVNLYTSLSELTIYTASRTLLGPEIRLGVQAEFAQLYQDLSDGISHLSFFLPNAPTAAHRRRDAARKRIVSIFEGIIKKRRATNNAEGHDDFLQTLIDSRYKDGSEIKHDDITGLLIAALFAGQHTSNITGTWVGYFILRNKEKLLPRLLAEQKEVLERTNGELTLEALNSMELLHNCVLEALRHFPPLIVLIRKATVDLKYKEYTIPAGDYVIVAPPLSHRLPEHFENPDEFDPDRFSPPRSEGEKAKWGFIPFGGGRHACLGRRFALMQIKTIWSVLMRNFELEAISDFPEPDYSAVVVGPKGDCMMRFRRKRPEDAFVAFPSRSEPLESKAASA